MRNSRVLFGKRNASNTQAFSRMELEKMARNFTTYSIWRAHPLWNAGMFNSFLGAQNYSRGHLSTLDPALKVIKSSTLIGAPQEHLEECQLGEKHDTNEMLNAKTRTQWTPRWISLDIFLSGDWRQGKMSQWVSRESTESCSAVEI